MALNLIQTNAYEVTPVLTLNAQTGTSYTFVLSDSVNTLVTAANASAIAITIPTNATVAYPVGSVLNFAQTLKHTKGSFAGEQVELEPFQIFLNKSQ